MIIIAVGDIVSISSFGSSNIITNNIIIIINIITSSPSSVSALESTTIIIVSIILMLIIIKAFPVRSITLNKLASSTLGSDIYGIHVSILQFAIYV